MNAVFYALLLLPAQLPTILGVIIIGLSFSRRNKFFALANWLGFSMIFAKLLKSLFGTAFIGLSGKAVWSYPSGHTLIAFFVWFWCVGNVYIPSKRTLVLPVLGSITLLIMLIISMAHYGYHQPIEVIAAVPFAAAVALLSHYWDKRGRHLPLWAKLSVPILMLEISIIAYLSQYQIWQYHLQIIGLTAGLGLATCLPRRLSILLSTLYFLLQACGLVAIFPTASAFTGGLAVGLLIWPLTGWVHQKTHGLLKTYASKD